MCLHVQVPVSNNPLLPSNRENGLLLPESIQLRIQVDPEPHNLRRAREVGYALPSLFGAAKYPHKYLLRCGACAESQGHMTINRSSACHVGNIVSRVGILQELISLSVGVPNIAIAVAHSHLCLLCAARHSPAVKGEGQEPT